MNAVTLYTPYIVMVIGAAVYGFIGHPKAAELGRLAFLSGLIAGLIGHVHCG